MSDWSLVEKVDAKKTAEGFDIIEEKRVIDEIIWKGDWEYNEPLQRFCRPRCLMRRYQHRQFYYHNNDGSFQRTYIGRDKYSESGWILLKPEQTSRISWTLAG